MRLLILILHAVLLSGCAGYSDWRMQKSVEKMRAEALKEIDVDACKNLAEK